MPNMLTTCSVSNVAKAIMMPLRNGVRIFTHGGGRSNLTHPDFSSLRLTSSNRVSEKAADFSPEPQAFGLDSNNNFSYATKATGSFSGCLSVFAPIRLLGGHGRFFVSEFAGGACVAQPVCSLR